MGVAADGGGTVFFGGAAAGAGLDLVGTTDEGFGAAFGKARHVVAAVDFLQEPVNSIGNPGENGVIVDEVIELMAVDDQYLFMARAEDEFLDDLHAQEVRDDIGRAVVIAGDPDDLDFVREVANLGRGLSSGSC